MIIFWGERYRSPSTTKQYVDRIQPPSISSKMTHGHPKRSPETVPWREFVPYVRSGGGLFLTNLAYQPAALLIAFACSRAGITPNMVSVVSALISTMGLIIPLAMKPVTPQLAFLCWLLLAFGYVADCADGQLARATNQKSKLGAWLDHMLDSYKSVLAHFFLGWFLIHTAVTSSEDISLPFVAFFVNLLGATLYAFGWNYKTAIGGKNLVERNIVSGPKRTILMLPLHFTDYGLFVFLFLLLPWRDILMSAYLLYGIITFIIYSLYLFISAYALAQE